MGVDENSTCRKFRQVANNGKKYNMNFYNLEEAIAVGFRTNSEREIVFRQVKEILSKNNRYLCNSSRTRDKGLDFAYFCGIIW